MLLGKTAADALTTPSAPFADVAADRWSAGSIAYAVSQGIIAGVGNNQFNPTGELTNAAFAKMLLTALGYDAEIEGLVGNDWALKTASLVNKIDLANGLGGVNYNATITRDQAAKLGFNTLKATVVYYDVSQNVGVGSTNAGDVTLSTGLRAIQSQEVDNSTGNVNSYKTNGNTPYTQFCEVHFDKLKLATNGSDDFDREANVWTFKGVKIGTYAKTATHTYTTKVGTDAEKKALKAVIEDYNNFNKNSEGTIALYQNGYSKGNFTNTDLVAELAALTGNGRQVEIFVSDNIIKRVVIFDTLLGKVTNVDTKNEKITIKF